MDKVIHIKNINKNEAARYLGYKDTLPDVEMTKIILTCEMELLKIIRPQYVYKIFDITFEEDGVHLVGTALVLKGDSIKNHLKGCTKAAIMCTTLSSDVDKLLRANEISNMVNAIVIDALANAAIEQVCDEVEKIIQEAVPEYCHTWRFGVGYGDFPISTQKIFLDTLNASKQIGVCATESSILTPRKSVTCVLGLSTEKTDKEGKSCENCNLKDTCSFRKSGKTCSN
ncbi:MAG: methionine synthase [Lachnospiraceae bacterium]|nr:methionine synthase [Lachnospiraceae bacterium]